MRTAWLGILLVTAVACGSSDDDGGSTAGGGGGTAGSGGSVADAAAGSSGVAGSVPDASAGSGGSAGDASTGGNAGSSSGGSGGAAGSSSGGSAGAAGSDAGTGNYKSSLSVCWTDPYCPRVFAIAHGGAWSLTGPPYDSNAAIAAAYAADVDGVKIDVRVTKDDVPVISHSSPIELYESVDCSGKKIEEMNASDVVKCHRFPSLTETFQRLDDVLKYIKGKMVVQLTVKLSSDYARTIAEVHAQGAEDFAFLEISTSELQNLIPTIPGSGNIYYLINVASNVSEVDTLIGTIKNPRAFMYEFDPTVDVSALTTSKLHPAGVRSFTYTDAAAPSQAQLQKLFDGGYDVVSSQGAANCVAARKVVNMKNGVSPP